MGLTTLLGSYGLRYSVVRLDSTLTASQQPFFMSGNLLGFDEEEQKSCNKCVNDACLSGALIPFGFYAVQELCRRDRLARCCCP